MIDLNILTSNPKLAKIVKLELTPADLLAFGESIHRKAIQDCIPKEEVETYLTPQQFADKVHVSLVTLWSWDKKGITRPLRIGNKKLYRRSDLEKILCRA